MNPLECFQLNNIYQTTVQLISYLKEEISIGEWVFKLCSIVLGLEEHEYLSVDVYLNYIYNIIMIGLPENKVDRVDRIVTFVLQLLLRNNK